MRSARYDVVVVGAGPAGSTAALEAAAAGASTLILERGERIGEPVRCGEFLPSLEEMRRICDDPPELDNLFDLPDFVMGTFIEGARAHAPSGKVYELDFQGHSIWRNRLDQYLAKEALKEGAELWKGTSFLDFRAQGLLTTRGVIRAKVVVGADGPQSTVAKACGFPQHSVLFPAISLPVEGSFDPVFEAFFGELAPGGYAWIIPRKEDANVGLGVRSDLRREPLTTALKRFLTARGMKSRHSPTGGFVPLSGPLPETVKGTVLLAGDAAGQVLSTSGGGIFTAMICGQLAGRAAARHVLGKAPLEEYERQWKRCLGGAFERGWRLFQAMAPTFADPDALEEVFSLLGSQGLAAALRCQELDLSPLLKLERPTAR